MRKYRPHEKKKQDRSQWIMGVNAIQEVIAHAPERIIEVYVAESRKDLQRACEQKGIPLQIKHKRDLEKIVESPSHQSVIARVRPRETHTLRELADKENSLILMLDSIFDPQNFGAILRSAEGFGADGVIYSKNRGGSVTPVVSKASAGASELVPLIEVSNLADSLRKLQDAGYEGIVADMNDATDLHEFSFPQKAVLILGSEGKGVQPLLKKRADHRVKIPMYGKISSLNVAQAATVLMAFWRHH